MTTQSEVTLEQKLVNQLTSIKTQRRPRSKRVYSQ